jgi:hypothetical protein
MQDQEMTSSYVELSTKAYGLFVDAFAAANQRGLDLAKSLYEVAARPYASLTPQAIVRENFERGNQMVSLTVDHMQAGGQKWAEFAEKAVTHGAQMQETFVAAMRGLVNTGISNMNFVKETTDRQMDDFSKRFDELQNRAAANVSSN